MRSAVLLGLLLLATTAAASASELSAHLGTDRILLAFAATDRDAGLQEQRALLGPFEAGMAERDLVLIAVTGSTVEDQALRSRYGARGGFVVLLIGKDGGVKLRSARPISPATLTATIDAMPMRRAERARR